jgi:hypothetical protein
MTRNQLFDSSLLALSSFSPSSCSRIAGRPYLHRNQLIAVNDTTNSRIQGRNLSAGSWVLLPPPAGCGPGAATGQFQSSEQNTLTAFLAEAVAGPLIGSELFL